MELESICRTCLSNEPQKNIADLKTLKDDDTCSDVVLFCLNIKVEADSKVSTKLCSKCYRKILSFYKFKLLALKNDAYLKTAESKNHIKNEKVLRNDVNVKEEHLSSYDSDVDNTFIIKIEPTPKDDTAEQSDNEFLSVIKKIKYEFVTDSLVDETKENSEAPTKTKRGKRGRPPKLKDLKTNKTPSTSQVCEECGKTVKNLREHSLQHLPQSARKRYSCKLCDKSFATYGARNNHNKIKHLGIKKTCPICGKSVVSLKHHILVMHDSESLPYECADCGRRFICPSALAGHMSLHTRERPYDCDKCDKKFRTKLVLRHHTRQVHDKEKTHLCQFCSKSFFKKYHLQVHLRSHTKEKPYQCGDCGKSFSSSTILNNHRTVHSDVKEHACTLCNMVFARLGYLRAHMISHTRERKHPCKYCGLKFGRSDHRKRHEHTAHERHLLSNLNDKDIASVIPCDPPRKANRTKQTEADGDHPLPAVVSYYEGQSVYDRNRNT